MLDGEWGKLWRSVKVLESKNYRTSEKRAGHSGFMIESHVHESEWVSEAHSKDQIKESVVIIRKYTGSHDPGMFKNRIQSCELKRNGFTRPFGKKGALQPSSHLLNCLRFLRLEPSER